VELGEAYLSKACAHYPRRILTIDNIVESPPSLSCPEAARLVLLNPSLMETYDPAAHIAVWNDSQKSAHPLQYFFWPLREFSFSLIRNRAYPLWQRIFLLGSFSRRLNAIAHDAKPDSCVPAVLRDFSAAVGSGTLRSSMEVIPANPALQFDFLLRLVLQRLDGVHRNPRLIETLNAFILGVDYGREATLEGQIEQYAAAYERYFAPFFLKHPYILENYLLHMIFYELFPMGGKLFTPAVIPDPAREFAELTIQFALIKGLLIGVAGHYKEAFSTEHVIQTVQTAFKHFEHNRNFMEEAYQLLFAQNLNNVSGLTMLVRN
jgi:lysine-N-methylase